jgi:RNA polymerase sigma factor (sigma-70 family)
MGVKELVDSEVIRKATAGCRNSANAVFEAYYDYVYRMAYYCVCERDWAEDIAHEVYLKYMKSIASYREEAAFSTWLYRVVVSVSIDQIRDRQRLRRLSDEYHREHERDEERRRSGVYVDPNVIPLFPKVASGSPEMDVYFQQLWDQILALPLRQRQAALLVHRDGLTHAEAAQLMNCKEGTVSGYLHDAYGRLKDRLEA